MSNPTATFPDRLRKAMQDNGLSQSAVAKRLGLSSSTVSRWLEGSVPRARALRDLSALLDVCPSYLAGDLQETQEYPTTAPDFSAIAEDAGCKFLLASLIEGSSPPYRRDLENLILANMRESTKEALAERAKEARARCNELIGRLTP